MPFESKVTVLPFVIPVAGIVVTDPSVPKTEAVFVVGSTPITTPVGVGVGVGAVGFSVGDKPPGVGCGPTCADGADTATSGTNIPDANCPLEI